MSEPEGTPETSMEAILASIRRIIAEDNIQPPPGVPPAPKPRQSPIEPSPILLNPAASPQAQTASVQPAPFAIQPVIVAPSNGQGPPAATPGVGPAPLASPPVSVSPSPAPSAVWGVLGDQHGAGEELVLTQMVAEDGSVVSFEKPQTRSAPAPSTTPKSKPLDVLLLTDALPGSQSDIAMPVTAPTAAPPTQAPPNPAPPSPPRAPASPAPATSARPVPPSPPATPVLRVEAARPAPAPAAPGAAPRPPATPQPDQARVGLASPETLVTSAAVMEQLTRARSQPAGQTSGQTFGPVPKQTPGLSAALTLEDLVRQSLEPRIQEWLNAHLQEIVERLVQKEIDKIISRT